MITGFTPADMYAAATQAAKPPDRLRSTRDARLHFTWTLQAAGSVDGSATHFIHRSQACPSYCLPSAVPFHMIETRNSGGSDVMAVEPRATVYLSTYMTNAGAVLRKAPRLTKGRLKNLISRLIRRGDATLPSAAAALGISPRSLQRHLKASGIIYSDLLSEVRYEIARSLLVSTALDIAEIAVTLGYNDPSSFSRAFARWSGASPRKFRMGLQPQTKPPNHEEFGDESQGLYAVRRGAEIVSERLSIWKPPAKIRFRTLIAFHRARTRSCQASLRFSCF